MQCGKLCINDFDTCVFYNGAVASCGDDLQTQTAKLYVDGMLSCSTSSSGEACTGGLYIGRHKTDTTTYWNGLIDDVQLFKRVITDEEVAGLAGTEPYLQAHWKLDGDANDETGSYNGTIYDGTVVHSSPVWTNGYDGQALQLDGINDYVQITGYKGIAGSQSRTCMAWIKTTATSKEILTWGAEPANGARWIIRVNEGGQLRAEVQGGNIIGTSIINDGNWHHIAVAL